MSSSTLLKVQGVSKRFGSVTALNQMSFSLSSGKILGIMGDNGSGKSTLVRILSGFHLASEGEIYVNGVLARMSTPAQASHLGIATVHQNLSLVDDLSIVRNFFLGHELTRFGFLDHRGMKNIAGDELKKLGLSLTNLDQSIRSLSGGEKQTVAFARACYFGKHLLILDEPTSALSIQATDRVFEYMRMAKARGMAVIIVTHNPQQALSICDDLLILFRGRKVAEVSAKIDKAELESWITTGAL